MPLYGNELDRSTNPFEANLGRVVKLDKAGDFVGRGRAREGRPGRDRPPARRARDARPGDRPPRLPGPRRRSSERGRDERHPVAVARRGDRDGLRRHGRCRRRVRWSTSRSAVSGSPPRSSPCRSTAGRADRGRRRGLASSHRRADAARSSSTRIARPARPAGRRSRPVADRQGGDSSDGPCGSALHQGPRVGPRGRRRGDGRDHRVRREPARRHRLRRAARTSAGASPSSPRSGSSSRSRPSATCSPR